MTIEKAVETLRSFQLHDPSDIAEAETVLSAEYLRLTDPTPLTVEVIGRELGPINKSSQSWLVAGHAIVWASNFKLATVRGGWLHTIGDLRQIVAMLRRSK